MAWALVVGGLAGAAEPPRAGDRGIPADALRPTQRIDRGTPPAAPEFTPADPGARLPERREPPATTMRVQRIRDASAPLPPAQFNPDPGATLKSSVVEASDSFFMLDPAPAARREDEPIPADRALPRAGTERVMLAGEVAPPTRKPESAALPPELRLPRSDARQNIHIPGYWSAPETYPLAVAGHGLPAHATPVLDRWRDTGFVPWRRYTAGDTNELPYAFIKPEQWHYYRPSVLKGDLPYRGQDLFVSLTASNETVFEDRILPVRGTSPTANSQSFTTAFGVQADVFRGETVFKPVAWQVRVRPVLSFTHVRADGGAARPGYHLALQEAYFEKHLRDLSVNYDFVSVRIGNQSFNSDFRGFIFNDTNFGARLFGNYDNNRWQYNIALFDLREKDFVSDLNTLDRRGQVVLIANVYRQDFGRKGYTAAASFHASFDEGGLQTGQNGARLRPAPFGGARLHRVDSVYLGWAGDGHLGRWNLSHAVYLALGRDEFNSVAGRAVNVFAQLAAAEVSYDRDWIRLKGSLLLASGDGNSRDGRATGFDSIFENANFTGGPFSFFARQGLALGAGRTLKTRFSLLPNLRPNKGAGQQNFVNPGLTLIGLGSDLALTQRLRAFASANRIGFAATDSIRTAEAIGPIARDFGTDLSVGLQWRPLLTENVIVSAGGGVLVPAAGYRDLYERGTVSVSGRWPRGAVAAVRLTY